MTPPAAPPLPAADRLYDELYAEHPDHVGHADRYVEHGGYRLAVADMGNIHRWSLTTVRDDTSRHCASGSAIDADAAWRWACCAYLTWSEADRDADTSWWPNTDEAA